METRDLQSALAENPFTTPLSPDQLAFLVGCTKNVRFQAGERLFAEGDPAEALFIVRQGQVALESYLPGRGMVGVETVSEGDVLGWATLFPPHRWHLTARALEATLAFSVDGACLRGKLELDSAFAYVFTKQLLYQAHRRLERARLQQLDAYKAEL